MAIERNLGDPRAGYPSAAEMPEMAEPMAPPDTESFAGLENPVIDALKTIQRFVMAQAQKGNPEAERMKESMAGFMNTITGMGETPPEQEEGESPVDMEKEAEPTDAPPPELPEGPERDVVEGKMAFNPFEEKEEEDEEREPKMKSKKNKDRKAVIL